MIYVLLCVICSTLLIVIFKIVGQRQIELLPVIVINYLTCVLLGVAITQDLTVFSDSWSQPWLPIALFIGLMFIVIFNLMGQSASKNGITVTAIANKMSVAIPVVAAYFLYGDSFPVIKVLGILLAFVALYLTSLPNSKEDKKEMTALWMIGVIFIGSGIVDSTINYVKKFHFSETNETSFLIFLFGTAFVLGALALIRQLMVGKTKIGSREILMGIALGIPNYGSIHFMMKALGQSHLQSSFVFPMINIGVVSLSAITAFIIFREKLSKANLLGIFIAILAIALLSFHEEITAWF